MKCNWQLQDWPNFSYNQAEVNDLLLDAVKQISLLTGSIKDSENQIDTIIGIMLSEALKSSEIEGDILNREEVYSSVRQHFGLKPLIKIKDSRANAISQIMVDAYQTFAKPLSHKQLNAWHQVLFQERSNIVVGNYRKHQEPMQVVSGHFGKVKIYFEAPPSTILKHEMQEFIKWFNNTAPGKAHEIKAAPLRAAMAHLYFESIHPYEDGNGRIGRIIAEKALSQTMGYPLLICLSQEIESKKKLYYSSLEKAQSTNEITAWLKYFLTMLIAATKRTNKLLTFVLSKSRFYNKYQDELNLRQAKLIKRMLDEGSDGFKGGINASKYMKITKCSKATATRDLQELQHKAILNKLDAGGRSTSYELNL
jgi:Fic family protein